MAEACNCTKEGTLARHDVEIIQLRKDVDSLDKIYDLIYGLTTNVSVMTSTMIGVTEDISQIKTDIKEIKSSDVASNVLVLTEQMDRNTKDISSTQKDIKAIQSKDGSDFIHYKRATIVFLIVTILGIVFASVKLL